MPEPSIHYRRRWFYVLWSVLLLGSLGGLYLWERPIRTERATLQFSLKVKGAPPGTRLQAWAGPRAAWPGGSWSGEGALADLPLRPEGATSLPLVRMAIARRRWIADYVPRGTWDLVMVKLTPPLGPARFVFVPVDSDIRVGRLRQGLRFIYVMEVSWQNLRVDGTLPNRLP